ncbi:nucleotide exchange factor GrpE [Alphaproteobacteria bacterium]|nr:nucleotide exchange factor GrpE [Alphaproteobacteria bacterium]
MSDKNEPLNSTDEEEIVEKEVNEYDEENEQDKGLDNQEDLTEKFNLDEEKISLNAQISDLKDQLLRTMAESENIRKRTLKEVEQAKKYSHISFVRDLVSSVDNLKRALDSVPDDKNDLPDPIKNLILGLEIVEKEIVTTLERHNIKQISPLGEKFDYNFHQAMFEVPTNNSEPGVVVEVSQNGYLLYERLVRPAMVGISKKIEQAGDKDNDKK